MRNLGCHLPAVKSQASVDGFSKLFWFSFSETSLLSHHGLSRSR